MSTKSKPAADPYALLGEIRAALLAELGGPDAAPASATLLDMIDALASLNRFYRNGWADAQDRLRQAKRTLVDNGITTHTTAPSGGAGALVPVSDVGHAIDLYRDQLRPEDRADGVPHAVARRHALAELAEGNAAVSVDDK